jgi:hypothetical protein
LLITIARVKSAKLIESSHLQWFHLTHRLLTTRHLEIRRLVDVDAATNAFNSMIPQFGEHILRPELHKKIEHRSPALNPSVYMCLYSCLYSCHESLVDRGL